MMMQGEMPPVIAGGQQLCNTNKLSSERRIYCDSKRGKMQTTVTTTHALSSLDKTFCSQEMEHVRRNKPDKTKVLSSEKKTDLG